MGKDLGGTGTTMTDRDMKMILSMMSYNPKSSKSLKVQTSSSEKLQVLDPFNGVQFDLKIPNKENPIANR